YFPRGTYMFGTTIDFSRLSNWNIVGDGSGAGGVGSGTQLRADINAVFLNADYGSGAGTFSIKNCTIKSGDVGGTALFARNAVLSTLENVQALGKVAIDMVNPVKCSLRSVVSMGDGHGGIGIRINGGYGTTVESSDFMALDAGVQVGGAV